MDGDDAVEFFDALVRAFAIDLSAMRWRRHFGPEGFNPLGYLLPSFWRWRRELLPITIADVLRAVHSRRWDFEYESSGSQPKLVV